MWPEGTFPTPRSRIAVILTTVNFSAPLASAKMVPAPPILAPGRPARPISPAAPGRRASALARAKALVSALMERRLAPVLLGVAITIIVDPARCVR
jgi:hypothetical protein